MPLVEVRLLGPIDLAVDGLPIELRRKKQRALLALLALRPGEVVSTDRLVDDLWGETPPKAAVGSLQNLVSELRKVIGSDMLLTRAPGYVLNIDRDLVDAHRFERKLREGRPRDALALWRGRALADLALEPFAAAEIGRLEELRTAAREDVFDEELEAGRHAQLVAELEAFIAEHPLRERPRGQLMLALYRSGRQADSLEAYRAARETLVDELGIDPSAELQQLEQAILRHDPSVGFECPAKVPTEPDRRRTVTMLFADVVDSTELAAQLDPEVLRAVMTHYFDAVRTVVEHHGGVVEKFIGDAAVAAFGVPTQHEDDALRAVRAASDLRAALGSLNAELGEDYGIALQLRMGLNSGEVLVSDPTAGESFATGKAVSVAQRLEQAALPGEILIGESTHAFVRHAVEAEQVEPLDLGGALGRVAAFRFLEVGEAVRPLGTASFVGRADELAWLRAAFAGVCAERRSKVVTVLGDAGVGKTRLASELITGLGAGAAALIGRCISYGEGATFLPLAEIVRQAAPTRPRQTIASLFADDEQAGLIAERVTQLTGHAEGVASMGEVFWAVRRFLEALALQRPHVVVVEDVHWAEPTLLDLLEYLDTWTVDAPLLVVCLSRQELFERRPGWGSAGKMLTLEPLEAEDAQTLVSELAGDEVSDDVRARIVQVAEGNALFLEQLLAFSEEAGVDVLATVPPSVEALLASRIDRLEPEERALLERAAVSGREFERAAVVHLSPPEELAGIDRSLARLVRRGLLERADGAFRFHHALIRDCAYAGITKETRADLHERFGSWLDQREEGAEEIVGYHFEQTHRYRTELRPSDPGLPRLAQRAGDRLAAAGIHAWKGADTPAAVNLLARGEALLQDTSQRAETLCELGVARGLNDLDTADRTLSGALACAEGARDRRVALRARIELSYIRLFTDRDADPDELLELVEEATPVFEELGDERALARAWRHLGYVRGSLQGGCAEWLDACERAFTYYRRTGWSPAGCMLEIAAALFYGPTPAPQAIGRCEQLLDESTDRLSTAGVLLYLAGLQALGERYEEAFSVLTEADWVLDELGEVAVKASNSGRIRGRVHLLAGDPELAEKSFRDSCAVLERMRDEAAFSTVATDVGRALAVQGRFDEASEWSRLAQAHAPSGDRTSQVEWRRLEATLLARKGLVDAAENLILDALRMTETTDLLTLRGDVLLDVSTVLAAAHLLPEAAQRIEEALAFYERKENLASARIAQARLAEVAVV